MKAREAFWFTILPVAIAVSFTQTKPLAIIQAAACAFLLGMKVMVYVIERRKI